MLLKIYLAQQIITIFMCQICKNCGAPLNNLLKKVTKWNWSAECQKAFEGIEKNINLTQLQIIAATDASEYDTGAVIGHTFEEGTVKAVTHASRGLTNTGKCYSQIENEALAMTFDIMKFHRMIWGRKFILLTDLIYSKKWVTRHTAKRLKRWATILLNYVFKMEFLSPKVGTRRWLVDIDIRYRRFWRCYDCFAGIQKRN